MGPASDEAKRQEKGNLMSINKLFSHIAGKIYNKSIREEDKAIQ